MPPDEPGLAPVIRLPVKRRPTFEQEERRLELLHARLEAQRLRRMKLKLALAGAALLGFLGVGMSMALDSIDEEGGPVAEEDGSFGDPFFEVSAEGDDRAGPAWFTTQGGGKRGR